MLSYAVPILCGVIFSDAFSLGPLKGLKIKRHQISARFHTKNASWRRAALDLKSEHALHEATIATLPRSMEDKIQVNDGSTLDNGFVEVPLLKAANNVLEIQVPPKLVAKAPTTKSLLKSVQEVVKCQATLIYEGAVSAGVVKANKSFRKIFKLGVVAGVYIAFGMYLSLAVGGNCPGITRDNPGLMKFIMGSIGIPTGQFMALVLGAETFTGNTALVTSAYMEGRVRRKALVNNWIASYLGNFSGAVLLAWLAYRGGTLVANPTMMGLAMAKCSLAWDVAFIRGMLCSWLMCTAVYMASGCSTMIGKMSKCPVSHAP